MKYLRIVFFIASSCSLFVIYQNFSNVTSSDLLNHALPLQIFEQMALSPALEEPGDQVQIRNLYGKKIMKIVVKNPKAPLNTFTVNANSSDPTGDLKKALQDAIKSNQPARIVIQAGTYRLLSNGGPFLTISGARDLTIDGLGATLLFQSANYSGISIQNSSRVKVIGLKLKYVDMPLASLGKISKVNGGYSLALDREFAANEGAPIVAINGIPNDYTLKNHQDIFTRISRESYYPVYNWEPSLHRYLFSKGNPIEYSIQPGKVLVRHMVYGAPCIVTGGSLNEDISFDRITVYNSPGMGIVASNIKRGFSLTNSKIIPDPKDPLALISTGSDGFHTENFGGDLILSGNEFTEMGDDAVNITNRIKKVLSSQVVNSDLFDMKVALSPQFISANNIVSLFDQNFTFMGLARVELGAKDTGSYANVSWGGSVHSERVYTVRLSRKLPAPFSSTLAVGDVSSAVYMRNLNFLAPRYLIANNKFHHLRGRGILAKAPIGEISQNQIVKTNSGGIDLVTEASLWYEGNGVALVNVMDNKILDVNHSQDPAVTSVLQVGLENESVLGMRIKNNKIRTDLLNCMNLNNVIWSRLAKNSCDGGNTTIQLNHVENIRTGGRSGPANDADFQATDVTGWFK
jgi:hypothetical protein